MEVEAAAADQAQQQLGAWFDSLDEQARSLEKQADLYGLTAAQIAAVTQARLEDALAQAKEEGAGEDRSRCWNANSTLANASPTPRSEWPKSSSSSSTNRPKRPTIRWKSSASRPPATSRTPWPTSSSTLRQGHPGHAAELRHHAPEDDRPGRGRRPRQAHVRRPGQGRRGQWLVRRRPRLAGRPIQERRRRRLYIGRPRRLLGTYCRPPHRLPLRPRRRPHGRSRARGHPAPQARRRRQARRRGGRWRPHHQRSRHRHQRPRRPPRRLARAPRKPWPR